MVHETAAARRASFGQRLLQRVEDEAGMRAAADAPADDTTGVGVDDEGDVDEA